MNKEAIHPRIPFAGSEAENPADGKYLNQIIIF